MRILGLILGALAVLLIPARAQLAITEVFPAASTNGTPALHTDWWELTNFGPSPIDLTGYRFNDSNGGLTNGVVTFEGIVIEAGESIVFFEQNATTGLPSVSDFQTWWGGNLPADLKLIPYSTNNIGLSSSGDSVRLWSPTATVEADVVAIAEFGAATNGVSFTYSTATGVFGTVSVLGTGGTFAATENGDLGSPGTTTGPVPLTIVSHPQSATVNPLGTATFTVAAQGQPQPRIRWLFQGVEIPGAFGPTLTITNVDATKTGTYRASLAVGDTIFLSNPAELKLTEQPTPPSFLVKPVNTGSFVGGGASFTVSATGVPVPTLQWFFKDQLLSGQTGTTLVLSNLTEAQSGEYRVTATNPSGSTNATAVLTVRPKPDLRITEVQSSAALDADFLTVFGFSKQDWWEVTSFETTPVSLLGWRLDDSSSSLASAYTITNAVTIRPGESIILVEVLTPEQFRTWWGAANLPASLQVISYTGSGLGLSSGGDGVRLWDATTTDNANTVAQANFGAAEAGVTFNYNPDTAVFGDKSVLGVNGVFAAAGFAGGGQDIGSPGRIREGTLPAVPPVVTIVWENNQLRLEFSAEAGRTYRAQARDVLSAGIWANEGNPQTPAQAGPVRIELPVPTGTTRFYQVVVE